ncbi:MAG: carbohydrate kinase, partial [Oscillospiraceae bacterium]|nr:carbohydrate kinase [Oscillospiraceae bacterium]
MKYLLAYDIGTTGVKTCLFEVDHSIRLAGCSSRSYPLYILADGGAEQDGDDWWNAMGESTKELLQTTGLAPEKIEGISFCSQ